MFMTIIQLIKQLRLQEKLELLLDIKENRAKVMLIDIDEITYWGRNTLIVMVTHLNIIYIIFNKILGVHSFGYVTGMIVFVLLLAVERIIIYVVNRYMPFLMGRKQKRGIKIWKNRCTLIW